MNLLTTQDRAVLNTVLCGGLVAYSCGPAQLLAIPGILFGTYVAMSADVDNPNPNNQFRAIQIEEDVSCGYAITIFSVLAAIPIVGGLIGFYVIKEI